MEASFMMAGVWTGAACGAVLMVPLLMEFCKRNLPVFFGLTMCLLALYLLSPVSPEIRAVWFPISQLPGHLATDLGALFGKLLAH